MSTNRAKTNAYIFLFALVFNVVMSQSVFANYYTIIDDKSHIYFLGQHAGDDFQGEFKDFSAKIKFNAGDLSNSFVKATINLDSAQTGNMMYDGTLPEKDWFNTSRFKEAYFTSKKITPIEKANTYLMVGDFELKGIKKEISFEFTVFESRDGYTKSQAEFPINRIDYGLGESSDPDADWVSEEIKIKLDLVTRKQ